MQTPQVKHFTMSPIVSHDPTFMSEQKARTLASKLDMDDEDGWRYRVVLLGRGTVVQVWDENGNALGYL